MDAEHGWGGAAQAVQGMWPSPERPFLPNRTNTAYLARPKCPFLQNRTVGMGLGVFACQFLGNRTSGVCLVGLHVRFWGIGHLEHD